MMPKEGRKRVVIENVSPCVDGGRFPAKRCAGDRVEVEADIFADGTIKVPVYTQEKKWVLVDGTYTIKDDGEIRYRAQTGEITLGGWYQYKDGTLTSAMGPKLRVTWKKVAEEKKPDEKN